MSPKPDRDATGEPAAAGAGAVAVTETGAVGSHLEGDRDGTSRRAGRAFAASGMAMPDFHDFFNAVSPAPTSVPGHVTFDVRWLPNGAAQKVSDTIFGFEGKFVPSAATIHFAVCDDASGVTYTSDDAGQVTIGGGVGKERNGVFFDCGTAAPATSTARVSTRSCWAK